MIDRPADLSVVIVSHGDQAWLPACLASLDRAARSEDLAVEVIVAENGPDADDLALDPGVLTLKQIRVPNRGFGAGNNDGIRHATADSVLLLNPDTEVHSGSLKAALEVLRRDPGVGCVAVKQIDETGALFPSIRRFPSVARSMAMAFACERLPAVGAVAGERELRMDRYEREVACDWTTGAVMLMRGEALRATGGFDERFFMFSEETDLCLRLKRLGWRTVHSPVLTVCHYVGRAGVSPRREAQMMYARLQYAEKHFGRLRSAVYRGSLMLGCAIRIVALRRRSSAGVTSAQAAEAGLRALLRREEPLKLTAVSN